MSAETIKRYRLYTLTDYEAEEKWLREMANQGWMLKRVIVPITYIFEKIDPADIVFKLDFQDTKVKPDDSYMHMVEDYGWTYLTTVNYYRYLYKKASGSEADDEIYTDNESKLEMLNRIIRHRILPIMVIFLCCVIPNVVRAMNNEFESVALNVFWFIMLAIYLMTLGKIGWGYRRLIRKYRSGS